MPTWLLVVLGVTVVAVAYRTRYHSDVKTCPDCAETVRGAALVCKHCGHRFSATPGDAA